MAVLIRMFFYLFLWGIGLMFFLYLLSSIRNSNPVKQEKKIWSRLQEILEGIVSDLTPLGDDEIRELSSSTPETRIKKNLRKGFVSTIFQEPVLAYTKEQMTSGRIYVVAQDSTETSYALRHAEGQTVFLLDGKVSGTIDANEVVKYEAMGKSTKVFMDCNSYPEYNVIMVDETPVAYLDKKGGNSSSDRFFSMVNDLDKFDSQLMVFLILYYKLIKHNN